MGNSHYPLLPQLGLPLSDDTYASVLQAGSGPGAKQCELIPWHNVYHGMAGMACKVMLIMTLSWRGGGGGGGGRGGIVLLYCCCTNNHYSLSFLLTLIVCPLWPGLYSPACRPLFPFHFTFSLLYWLGSTQLSHTYY